jgi:hypothetical protein
MAYSALTNIADWKDLLTQIKTFAIAQGWSASGTTGYDDIAANAQLGVSKGNCFLSIGKRPSGENPVARTDAYNGGTVNDAILNMVVNHSLADAGSNKNFWAHPDGPINVNIVPTDSDADRVVINDLNGTFSNVWLFSNAGGTYIWVVTQQGGDRFNIFGFGVLDKKTMTTPDVAFCVGTDYYWWPTYADPANPTYSVQNSPAWTGHTVGLLGENAGVMCFLPDAVLDPGLGFIDGAFQTKSIMPIGTRGSSAASHQAFNAPGYVIDYFLTVDNQETTMGIPLSSLPVFYRQAGTLYEVYLGDFPDIRLVMLQGLTITQEITYGGETWKVFPLKRKDSRATISTGASPSHLLNTMDVGFAIKKI